MHFIPELPPPRKILPPLKRRLAFLLVGAVAVFIRILSFPWRACQKPHDAVLIYEPFGLGDAILLQPLALSLLKTHTSVFLAVNPAWHSLFPPAPGLTLLAASPAYANPSVSHKYKNPLRDLLASAAALRPLARGAVCVDPRGDVRAIVLLYLAGAKRVHSLKRYFSANDCLVMPFAAIRLPIDRSVSRRLLSLRCFAPSADPSLRPTLPLPRTLPPVVPNSVAIIPTTPWKGKRWPEKHWLKLLRLLKGAGFAPSILCSERDLPHVQALAQNSDTLVQTVSSPLDWITQLLPFSAVISVNTGPMHIADALNKRLIVLDGPSRLPLWAPENPNAVVLHHLHDVPWAPPAPVDDGLRTQRSCMALITPEEVMAEIHNSQFTIHNS